MATIKSTKTSDRADTTRNLQADYLDIPALPHEKLASASQDPYKPKVEISNEPQGTVTHRTWTEGPHKGEKEDEFANGTKVHYTPDGKGGEYVESTGPNGHDGISESSCDGM